MIPVEQLLHGDNRDEPFFTTVTVDTIYTMHYAVFSGGGYYSYYALRSIFGGGYYLYYTLCSILGDEYYLYYALRSIFWGWILFILGTT